MKLEVETAGAVNCDFSNYLAHNLRPHPNSLIPGNPNVANSRMNIGPLRWQLKLSATCIEAELLLKEAHIARCEVKVEVDCPRDRRDSIESFTFV